MFEGVEPHRRGWIKGDIDRVAGGLLRLDVTKVGGRRGLKVFKTNKVVLLGHFVRDFI